MEDKKDNFQQILNEKIIKLQDCQKSKNIDSCLKCENVIECKIRKEYVDSVYASMNKGSGGFFNFETE